MTLDYTFDSISGHLTIKEGSTEIGREFTDRKEIKSISIPSSITLIGDIAFRDDSLERVDIPDSVITLGEYAFGYNNITQATLGKSLEVIGKGAFYGNNLSTITIPDQVKEIGDGAFNMNNITSVQLPISLSTIGGGAFQNNRLRSLEIPGSVEAIGNYAFSVNSLSNIEFSDGLEFIGTHAFSANYLQEVVIPDSVKTIENHAFWNNNIRRVTIPDSVISIGQDAFLENNLTEVELPYHFKDKVPARAFDLGVNFSYRDPAPNSEPTPTPVPEESPGPLPESEPYEGIISSVIGKGKLKGTSVADAFTFDSFEAFTKKTADRIIGFNPRQGDTIAVSPTAFPSLNGDSRLKLASTKSKKELKQLSKQDYDFVYFEKKGRLYFDGNGSDKNWGDANEGGLFAVLKGKPDLTVEDFTLLA